jgi:hypothetical protein
MRESRLQSWMEESPLRQEPTEPVRSASQASHHSRTPSSDTNIRPTSALDLRTQMDELKGRISSLRERAQEDKVKRLSISSMRTPSPFSTAEQWYTDGEAYKNHALSADAGVGWSPNQSPTAIHSSKDFPLITSKRSGGNATSALPPIHDIQTEYAESHYQDAEETLNGLEEESRKADEDAKRASVHLLHDPEDDGEDEDGFYPDNQDTESSSGNSEYYEAVPVLAERHEDRADAFDYENFFLHSAMGSFTRERTGSFSSEDSIETTRPASPQRPATAVQIEAQNQRSPSLHHRSISHDSISTVATFQTAVEENEFDDEEENEDEDDEVVEPDLTPPTPPTEFLPSSNHTISVDTSPKSARVSGNAFSHSFSDTHERPLSKLMSSFLEIDALSQEPSAMLEQERELVGNVIESLRRVCADLQKHDGSDYERKIWRRRLDGARRVLDGEFEAQAM